jgi:rhodanese-related sulfurtransferase
VATSTRVVHLLGDLGVKASALAGGFDAWRKRFSVEAIPAETPG